MPRTNAAYEAATAATADTTIITSSAYTATVVRTEDYGITNLDRLEGHGFTQSVHPRFQGMY